MVGYIVKTLQWTGKNHDEFKAFGLPIVAQERKIDGAVFIQTPEGPRKLYKGDTITIQVAE